MLKFKRSTTEVEERDLCLTNEETRGNTSEQPLVLQDDLESHDYEEINVQSGSGILELQHNVACSGIGLQCYSGTTLEHQT